MVSSPTSQQGSAAQRRRDDEAGRWLASLTADEFTATLARAAPADRPALWRGRLRFDRESFCRAMWPERFGLPFNALHRELFALQEQGSWRDRPRDVQQAVAAPRGFAKSTLESFAGLAHGIVYDLEAYLVVLSATQRLSLSLSRDLRNAFRAKDTPFSRLYGPFRVTGGVGEWEVSVRGRPSIGVLARSFGTEVRGAKHPERGIRPTRVVIDDGEKKDRVRNPDQRALWWEALTKDVLKLAPRQGGTVFSVVGTILHPDSMLARLMSDAGWKSQRWKAIVEWPKRMDLWERCRAIWVDLSLGKRRRDAALMFYRANRTAMDEGAKLLDPAAKSLFDLFEILWSQGLASFLSELQNEPVDPTSQIFWSERFSRFREVETPEGTVLEVLGVDGQVVRRVKVRDLRLHGRWDPATGTAFGDYACIAIVGRDQHGYSYVLDVWMRRAKPSEQLAAAWTLAERRGLRRMHVEGVGFQALVAEPYMREREARREAGRFWQLQIEPVPETENKELRISTLEPDCTNGWISFGANVPREALEQFDQFPSGSHDDAPDAVHGAWKHLGGRPIGMRD